MLANINKEDGLNYEEIVLKPQIPSPDSSGNPYCFFFKNNKIATNSGK